MKATQAKLLGILRNASQFIIPINQRTYSWTLKECQQLWADILRAGSSEEIGVHFIGSVVHIDEGLGQPSRIHFTRRVDGRSAERAPPVHDPRCCRSRGNRQRDSATNQ